MWSLFARSRRAPRASSPRPVTLSLERLEDRLAPSGEMLSMFVTYDPNKQVTLTGQLANQSGPMAGQTIDLGGSVNGTATTNANGNYSVTLSVSQLGQVTAVSADGQSNTCMAMLMSAAPTITNFNATPEGGGVWLLSGNVTGQPLQGTVVNFAGIKAVDGEQETVNANGTFNLYVTVSSGNGGLVEAEAVDWWGDTSQEASEYVTA